MKTVSLNQLLAPPPPRDIHESFAAYLELLDLGDELLRAGIRQGIGPNGDLEAAYRRWNQDRMESRTRDTIWMLQRLHRLGDAHAR
jgi:hypothetical protein